MADYKKIKDLVYKFSNLGIEKSIETGAIKIGHAPYIAPLTYLNCLFPIINDEQINYIETEIKKSLPKSFAQFMKYFSNGLDILTDTICLYGLRFHYIRTVEMSWQPYDIIECNNFERPNNATHDMVFIGGYNWDGSKLYMTPDEKVHYCARWDATSLKTWDSLTGMLIEEIERLYTLFDDHGVELDPDRPTTPLVE